jgi:Ni2+-binding GTPase involved in maturation of urease and hydrogenase
MKLHLVGGFLGSGKSTAIHNACKELEKLKIKTAVITNDQGEQLVDSKFFQQADIAYKEVLNGCFCCNYNQLDKSIASLLKEQNCEVIFAESVGTCTDLVATIAKPLNLNYPDMEVSITVFADATLLSSLISGDSCFLDETVQYIYKKQLEEADILVVNKIDLLDDLQLQNIKYVIEADYPGKIILYQNSLNDENIRRWLKISGDFKLKLNRRLIDLDYDTYGAGEAKLAWLDETLNIEAQDGSAFELALKIVNRIHTAIKDLKYPIGHLKFLIDNGRQSAKISYTTSDHPENNLPSHFESTNTASLLINARVQTQPSLLLNIVQTIIDRLVQEKRVNIDVVNCSAFQPGYPRPTHRMA